MVGIALPTTSMPGQYQQESGGRLVNCFVESLGDTAASKVVLRRAPGLSTFAETTPFSVFRGAIEVNSSVYAVWSSGKVYKVESDGSTTLLTGSIPGSTPVILARNNAATPDLVCVAPGDGAFVITTTAVSVYPDADVGSPNSVCFLKGYFIFSYGDGGMQASGLNATSIDTLDSATAESKPDGLYRVVPDGDVLIAAGSGSIEHWAVNNEAAGFPFSPVATQKPARGIVGPYAIGGHEEGFGNGIFFVADDNTVKQINGYSSTKISPPDLDRLIEAVEDKTTIQVSAYITQGHPWVVVQCDDWTWEFDVGYSTWHERKSYNLVRWRGLLPFKAFDKWMCGNTQNSNLFVISTTTRTEDGEPLLCDIETGPMGAFPDGVSVDTVSILCSVGVGRAPGAEPIETDPSIMIFISTDNGLKWSNPWIRPLGAQAQGLRQVTVNDLGHAGPMGFKLKLRVSDPVHVGIMGGDAAVTRLAG